MRSDCGNCPARKRPDRAIRWCIPSLLLNYHLPICVLPATAGTLHNPLGPGASDCPAPAARAVSLSRLRRLDSADHLHGQFVICHVYETSFFVDTQDTTHSATENLPQT